MRFSSQEWNFYIKLKSFLETFLEYLLPWDALSIFDRFLKAFLIVSLSLFQESFRSS